MVFGSGSRSAGTHAAILVVGFLIVAALVGAWRATPSIAWTTAGATSAHRTYSIEDFTASTRLAGAAFTADERAIITSSDATGLFNLHEVPLAGGPMRQLTDSRTESFFVVSAFPSGDRVLFRHDRGGDERDHLVVREPDGRLRDLTPGDGHRAAFLGWAQDDRSFFIQTNERDHRYYDVYRVDADTLERTPFYTDRTGFVIACVSPDGRWIALKKSSGFANSDIWLHDRERQRLQHVTPHVGLVLNEPATFDPASRWFYFLSNEGAEFTRVRRIELATGRVEGVEAARWDIGWTTFSKRGTYRATGVNEDGRTVVRLWHEPTGSQIPLPVPPDGQIKGLWFSPSETTLAFLADRARSPDDLYAFDLRTRALSKLTDSRSPRLDERDLVSAEVVRFRSFDGLSIPAILHKPLDASARNPRGAIVYVHGGPGGQSRLGYCPLTQYLVNNGYAVLAVNNRGSSGYGQTFFTADDRRHGREPLWDCIAGRRWLAAQPWVDRDRIAIVGASYGGYMVLAAMAFHPGEFAAGVDMFGPANALRSLFLVPPWLTDFRDGLYREVGNPWDPRDWGMLYQISPLFSAHRISRPLLVVQGANDSRVPAQESEDIVAAVRANGVPVEYLFLPDEGHGFTKKKNEQLVFRRMKEFLDRHMPRRGEVAVD